MKISEEFPSKYLKGPDLGGKEVRVTMQNVEKEKLGDDNKLVLYFKGKEKGLVLNKTNSNTISAAYGDDTEDWYDQPLILFTVIAEFPGRPPGPALRVRIPTARDNKPTPKATVNGNGHDDDRPRRDPISSGPQRVMAEALDDEIPF